MPSLTPNILLNLSEVNECKEQYECKRHMKPGKVLHAAREPCIGYPCTSILYRFVVNWLFEVPVSI